MVEDYSITVIIPNYNNEKYIGECLQSILNQSLQPTEIIVVDDHSTDSSVSVIQEYEKQYSIVHGIYLKENGGVSRARNIGLENAKTQYVTYIDGDDYYYSKNKLKNEMEMIKYFRQKGKEIMAYSSTVHVSESGEVIKFPSSRKSKYLSGKVKYALIARDKNDTIPRDYCVRREILLGVGAYSFYKNFYEDLDLLMRLADVVEFIPTYEPGTAYRNTNSGLSKRKMEEHTETINEIVRMYYEKQGYAGRCIVKIINIKWRLKNKIKRIVSGNLE